MGVGSNWPGVQRRLPSVLRARADCRGRLFTAKLGIITDDCMHQVFDQLPSDRAILLARQFRDCLRGRINDFGFRAVDFV